MAVEEPSFEVVLQEGSYSVRDYPAQIAAETVVQGERSQSISAGFRMLAGFIFGGNTRRQSIAMTAPVLQQPSAGESIPMTAPVTQSGSAGAWTIRFIMPRAYTLETLPQPNDARVRLVPVPRTRYAVVQFSGLAREGDIAQKTTDLKAFIATHRLIETGDSTLARYDPPWTLWFLRRNEIQIPVRDAAPQ